MNESLQFRFDPNQFNRLFPFYILVDEQLKIISVGQSLKKVSSAKVGERFSRYFERNNIPQEVLKVLDYDNNGQLTREDLNQLMINQYNLTEMIGATESLKSLEEF